MTYLKDYGAIVSALKAEVYYQKWRQANPGEAGKFDAMYTAILAGETPTLPVLATAYGRRLVLEAEMALDLKSATATQATPRERLWADTSPWNTPIGEASVHPDSDAMVQSFQANYGPVFDPNYGVNVFPASASDPIRKCYVRQYVGSLGTVALVQMPDRVVPTSGTDRKWAVLSPDGTLCEVWSASKLADGSWDVGSIGKTDANQGSGWFKDGTTGSNASSLGGIIRGEEIAAGKIEHALAVSLPQNSVANFFVPPALKTDGMYNGRIPEGARLQLDPAFDLVSLPSWARPIGEAMQVYGMYVVDKGGAMSVVIEGGDSPANASWPAPKGDLNAIGIKQHLRVLAW